MKKLDKTILTDLYLTQQFTPDQIGERLDCNHKTVRKYLRLYGIPLRSASEYNYLAKKTHISPDRSKLFSKCSIVGHSLYLAEGWHTEKTCCLQFCNTDPILVNAFLACLTDVYSVGKFKLAIICKDIGEAEILQSLYPQGKVYLEPTRVTPIVRVSAGGLVLAREFISNAYMILSSKE